MIDMRGDLLAEKTIEIVARLRLSVMMMMLLLLWMKVVVIKMMVMA